jgi:hypothetical protein
MGIAVNNHEEFCDKDGKKADEGQLLEGGCRIEQQQDRHDERERVTNYFRGVLSGTTNSFFQSVL